jgi:tRNA-binding EMAP/Myf-like protein
MRVPLSWLREYVSLAEPVDTTEVSRRLTAAGLEVEAVESVGHDIQGVVVAQVLSIEELAGLKKPIRYCRVAVSDSQLAGPPDEASGVICGAVNFAVGDRVALALPGAALPGGFEIGARKTYGHISEGMICSASELALGDDHTGILVLPADAPLGADSRASSPARSACRSPTRPRRTSPVRTCSAGRWTTLAPTSIRPASPTRPAATGSCCARCAASIRRPALRCGWWSGWPGAGSAPCRSRWM